MAGKRLWEPDALRALAIIPIIIHVAHFYMGQSSAIYSFLASIDYYITDLGLGLFFFISGYLLYYNHPKIAGSRDIIDFLKKRLLRIYPLYWAAFILSIFVFVYLRMYFFSSLDFNLGEIIVNFAGLQSLTNEPILTFWFVSVIIVFYALYPLIVGISRKTESLILISLCITALMLLVFTITHKIDGRLYIYFFVFASGIISCRAGIFDDRRLDRFIPILAIFLVTAIASIAVVFNGGSYIVHGFSIINIFRTLSSLAMINISLISFSLLSFWAVRRYGSPEWSKKLFLPQISYGSYAAFLFVAVCYSVVYAVLQFIGVYGYLSDITIVIVAFPLSLAFGYFMQSLEKKLRHAVGVLGGRSSRVTINTE